MGNKNIAIGLDAMKHMSGSENVFIGYSEINDPPVEPCPMSHDLPVAQLESPSKLRIAFALAWVISMACMAMSLIK